MFWRLARSVLAGALAALVCFVVGMALAPWDVRQDVVRSAWAQIGCVPNPNVSAPMLQQFVNGCDLPASALNALGIRFQPIYFGARGNGTGDDSNVLQGSINSAIAAGVPVFLGDGVIPRKYLIKTGLVASGVLHLNGDVGNFGIFGSSNGVYTCPTGIIVAQDGIVALTLTGSTYHVENLCIQMGTSEGQRLSGAAISTGAASGNIQSGGIIENVAIFFPYEGLLLDSDPGGLLVTQQQNTFRNIMIRAPTATGVVVGRSSTSDATSGAVLDNIYVACGGTGTLGNTQIGTLFMDGDMTWDGKDQGNADCFINMKIAPGSNQNVGGDFRGTVGDSAGTHASAGTPHDLLIQPASGGIVGFLRFGSNAWISGGTTPHGDVPVLISNPSGAPTANCINIMFVGATMRTGGTSKIFDYEGGCENLQLIGNNIVAWNNGTVTDGIYLHPLNSGTEGVITLQGNHVGVSDYTGATVTNCLHLVPNSTVMQAVITGNNFSDCSTPINYTPSDEDVIIRNNSGVDDIPCSVNSGATISIPNACVDVRVSGSSTVTNITNSAWFNREFRLYAAAGFTLNAGGSPGLCSASNITLAAGISQWLAWNNGGGCYMAVQ